MPDETLTISGQWLTNLRKQVEDMDYCVLCDNHPSHDHEKGCPLGSPIRS